MSTVANFFEKNNGEMIYLSIWSWQGHSLESRKAYRSVMPDSDTAYEWFKKLKFVETCENEKYFGVITTTEKRNYVSECGAYEEVEEESKYYIKKNIVTWAIKNCKSHRHLLNTLRKNFNKKS